MRHHFRTALTRGLAWAALGLLLSVCTPAFAESKTEIGFPTDPYWTQAPHGGQEPPWVKFVILLQNPDIVYFQNGSEYLFHYDFAAAELAPFAGMTRDAYDAVTLYTDGRIAWKGAILQEPGSAGVPPSECGIQIGSRDPLTVDEIETVFRAVKDALVAASAPQVFYMPTYEQQAVAEGQREALSARGITVASAERWARGNACYAPGWTIGRLNHIASEEIEDAFLSGALRPSDVLLTDAVPCEIPLVAGIVSLSPATPNSHVAILARTWNVPFGYMALAEDAERALGLAGRRVVLRAYDPNGYVSEPEVRLIDVEDDLTTQTALDVLDLKKPEPVDVDPATPLGAWSRATDDLRPSDIRFFGGKASNMGVLREAIPENSPVSVGFSFDLWNGFMDQRLRDGRTLRATVAERLAPHTWPPSDPLALDDDLDDIRDMIRDDDETVFPETLRLAVIATLLDPRYGFDPNRNIRFRSSTNVEDLERFTGAGLYDSYSGCLADDLDGDDDGPSHCDPTEKKERGVFRAIRRVFASFYNRNAFLERLRLSIPEEDCAMALLVHHSFPDEIELANGVATLERTQPDADRIENSIDIVSQAGAVSVTNPKDGALPEEVSVYVSPWNGALYPYFEQASNLVVQGGTVLVWPSEYEELSAMLLTAADAWCRITSRTEVLLDFEFKKTAPDGALVVKQIRQMPRPCEGDLVTPFLVNEPVEYETFMGEGWDILGTHRLKSRWRFSTKNGWLGDLAESGTFFAEVRWERMASGVLCADESCVETWPGFRHTTLPDPYEVNYRKTIDAWDSPDGATSRTFRLEVQGIPFKALRDCPAVLTLSDFGGYPAGIDLGARYDRPMPRLDYEEMSTTQEDWARLFRNPGPSDSDTLQERSVESDGVRIVTRFYWPPRPGGAVAGYTSPLARWDATTIEGLTSEKVVLQNWYAQTYVPGHHNYFEDFLFEPQVEPGVSEGALEELKARDIRYIRLRFGWGEPQILYYGFDAGDCAAQEYWRLY